MKYDLLGVVMTRCVSKVISTHRSKTFVFRCATLNSEIQFQSPKTLRIKKWIITKNLNV